MILQYNRAVLFWEKMVSPRRVVREVSQNSDRLQFPTRTGGGHEVGGRGGGGGGGEWVMRTQTNNLP